MVHMRIRSIGAASLITFGILLSTPEVALAQGAAFGYAFVSPVAVSNIGDRTLAWNVGGGGEAWVGNGTSIGGELGYLHFPPAESSGPGYHSLTPSTAMSLLSLNGSHHFSGSDRATGWRPFMTGGMSFLLGSESIGFFNIGGGVDRWVAPRAGLRFELRDQFFVAPGSAGSALLGFRVGIILR
jgi:hypothetical protein